MDVTLEIHGGRGDELQIFEAELREDLEEQGIQVDFTVADPEPGALGAMEIITFLTDELMLPVLVQMISDYVSQRIHQPDGADLKARITRTDLPDGTKHTELTVEGSAKDVATVLKELR